MQDLCSNIGRNIETPHIEITTHKKGCYIAVTALVFWQVCDILIVYEHQMHIL